MEKEKSFSVYKHTNKLNKKVYIGITSLSAEKRWRNGRGYRNNKHFSFSINRYGWDSFSHDIIATGLSKEDAEIMEIKLIKEYDSTDQSKGYNICSGGNVSSNMSAHTRNKIRKARQGNDNPFFGKKHSLISRQKMSDSSKGSTPWNKSKKGIYTKDTINKMSKAKSDLYNGADNPMYGKNHTKDAKEKIGRATSKRVTCDGIIFESVRSCSEHYGIKPRRMYDYIQGKGKDFEKFKGVGLSYLNKKEIIK